MADVLVTLYIDGAQIRGKGYSTSMTFEITSTGFIVNNTQVWTYSGDSVFAGFSQNSGANVYSVGTTGHIGDFNISVQSLYLNSMEESEPTITYYITNSTELTSVADAIRTKCGTSESLVYPTEFVSAIENMSGNNYSTVTLHETTTKTSSYTLYSIPKTEVDLVISDIPCIVFVSVFNQFYIGFDSIKIYEDCINEFDCFKGKLEKSYYEKNKVDQSDLRLLYNEFNANKKSYFI